MTIDLTVDGPMTLLCGLCYYLFELHKTETKTYSSLYALHLGTEETKEGEEKGGNG